MSVAPTEIKKKKGVALAGVSAGQRLSKMSRKERQRLLKNRRETRSLHDGK